MSVRGGAHARRAIHRRLSLRAFFGFVERTSTTVQRDLPLARSAPLEETHEETPGALAAPPIAPRRPARSVPARHRAPSGLSFAACERTAHAGIIGFPSVP